MVLSIFNLWEIQVYEIAPHSYLNGYDKRQAMNWRELPAVGSKLIRYFRKMRWSILKKLKVELPCQLALLLFDIPNLKLVYQGDIFTP